MTYSVNSIGFSGVLPPGGSSALGTNPFTSAGFGGVPNIFPQSSPPLAFGVPGVPAGMNFAAGAPGMGAPLPLDPLTGLPVGGGLDFGLNAMPQGVPLGQPGPTGFGAGPLSPSLPQSQFGIPPQAGGMPPQPASGNPILDLLTGLLNSPLLQNLLGAPAEAVPVEEEALAEEEALDEGESASATEETEEEAEPIADPATALTAIIGEAEDIAAADGDASSVSTADLAAAARNKDEDVTSEGQAAAKFLLGNPALWSKIDKLDGEEDTKSSIEDLGKAISDPDILATTADEESSETSDALGEDGTITDNATALDLLSSKFEEIAEMDDDGESVSKIDLSRAIRESDDEEVKAIARYLQSNPDFFDDIASKRGKITLDDVEKALDNPNILEGSAGDESTDSEDLKAADILKTIEENKDEADTAGGGAEDELIGEKELKAIAKNKDNEFDSELAAAAEALLDDEELLKSLGGDDKVFSFDELKTFVENAEKNPDAEPDELAGIDSADEAFDVLNKEGNLDLLKRNADDEYVDFSYLDTIINGDGDQYSEELKEAAKYLKENLENDPQFKKIKEEAGLGDKIPASLIADIASRGIDAVAKDVDFDENDLPRAHKKALEVLTENNNALIDKIDIADEGGDKDGKLSDDDFKAALADDSGKYTAREKAAIKHIVEWNGGKLLDQLNADDSTTGKDDITNSLQDQEIDGKKFDEIT